LHKDLSLVSSIIKIAVIFAMFGKDFTDPSTLLVAIELPLLYRWLRRIPNGGYIGEILAITIYGFPMEQACRHDCGYLSRPNGYFVEC
jgi:hypothetical protein